MNVCRCSLALAAITGLLICGGQSVWAQTSQPAQTNAPGAVVASSSIPNIPVERVVSQLQQHILALDKGQLTFEYTKQVFGESAPRVHDTISFVYDLAHRHSRWDVTANAPSDYYPKGHVTGIWDGQKYSLVILPLSSSVADLHKAVINGAVMLRKENGGMGVFFARYFGFEMMGAPATQFGEVVKHSTVSLVSLDGTPCILLSNPGGQMWLDVKTGMLKSYILKDVSGRTVESLHVDEYGSIGVVPVPIKTTIGIYEDGQRGGEITIKLLQEKCVLGKPLATDWLVPQIPTGTVIRDEIAGKSYVKGNATADPTAPLSSLQQRLDTILENAPPAATH